MNELELHRKLNQKKTIVGEDILPTLEKPKYGVSTFGVKVFTDSKDLFDQLTETSNSSSSIVENSHYGEFYYISNSQKNSPSSEVLSGLQSMSQDQPGEIYSNKYLNKFFFKGPEKYGTVIGMICGIRSLGIIDGGWLGLHSSCLLNTETNTVDLLIGESQSGKSTFSHLVENNDNKHNLLSDDWCEVSMQGDTIIARPITTFLSESDNTELVFESYGKKFYKSKPHDPVSSYKVKNVIAMHCSKSSIDSDKEFIQNTLHHIPFIPQIFGKTSYSNLSPEDITRTNELIKRKYESILSVFGNIKKNKNYHNVLNIKEEVSLEQVYKEILAILSNK